jgi:hypothetical protein
MKNLLLSGLSSLLLPMGAYAGTPSAGTYQRTYLSSSISASTNEVTHTSTALPRDLIDLSGEQLDIQHAHYVRELVIVDGAVAEADKAVLRRAVKPGVQIVELNSTSAGLPQLIHALDGHKNLAAIHVVSHAEAGAILLGNSRITPESIQKEVQTFAALKGAVREGGDLLFYGCDLAANDAGEELLDIISNKTGLDVAASNNLTGNHDLQGDWELEVKRGNIESGLAFSNKALADFSSVLVASNGTKTFTGWSGNNTAQLSTTDFRLTAKNGNGSTPNVGIYVGGIGYMLTGASNDNSNHYLYLKADGTNTTAFELTGLTGGEAPGLGGAFTNVRIVGMVQSGGTVNSSTLVASGVDETFTFGSGQLTSFSGVKLKGFKLYFDCDGSCSTNEQAFFEFRNFTIQNAVNTPPPPTVTHGNISISGASGTGGAYKIGDTVTATWNNTAGGDNNSIVSGVTVNFSQFGGGTAVAATNSSGTWTATYTITAGAIDNTARNVSVTATNAGGSNTTADQTNATVDSIAPTVTDGRISISGASGTLGAYKIGDTVTATWNNTAGGDNNSDTINPVTVNFSQFGGGAAVSAANSSGTWTATYTIVGGVIDTTNRNISFTATDNAGNATTTADTTNATVDNAAPTVSSIVVSGSPASSDTSMAFIANFSESVVNVSTDDFTLVGTGSASGSIVSVSASTGSAITVNIAGITGTGTLKVNLNGSTNVADDAGNTVAAYSSGATHSVSILTAPGAPTIGTATAGNAQANVTFTAPGSNGGSAITTYTATANPGGAFGTCAGPAACTATVTGLTNGLAYTFTVTASNAIGTGSASGASNSVTPKGAQTITFANPGAQNFGTTPTLSATATSSLTPTFSSSTTGVCTITSGGALTFVTAGSCTIDADQAGNTAWNAATTVTQTFTVNAVVPSAPTVGTATAGDTQATVTFTAPASTGGAVIIASGYTVTANPGGATATGSSSPITVTGLTNGVAYTFTVTATNSAGTGSASAASNSVTPAAPQTITFANPGTKNFGTTPTLSASANSGLIPTFTSSTTGVCTITTGGALTFVTTGTCTINADQAGDNSYLAATQVSQSFTVAAVVAGAPTVGVATASDTQASIAFVAPAFTGGTAITGYTVTSNPADVAPVNGASSPIVVTGLTNGQAYTFTVTATNSAGTGAASAASNSVIPKATQTITFSNPGTQSFGTTPTFTATADSGLNPTFTSSTTGVCAITTVGAVTFITAGTCTINADQAGNGSYLAASQVSRSFTVAAVVPNAPTVGTATAGNTQASITFTAPAFTGGATVTGYTVTASPGGATGTGAGSPITVTGLTNGVAYTFTVTATNSAGTGSASAASNSVTPVASQTVTFANPGTQNFGTTPTFTASATSGLSVTFSSSTTSVCTITTGGALTILSTGTCTITASQAGNGSYSAATPVNQSFSVSAVVPGAPTVGTATAGNAQASVTFTAPGFNGGATVTGYTVTANPGGATATGATSPITVTGLTNGTAYTFTVRAINSAGTGSPSAASNSVTPIATQNISFANPGTQNLGTSPTLSATATSGLAVTFSSSTTSVCTITSGGLLTLITNGTCTINANQAGNSAYLAATVVSQSFSVAVVVPGAPTIGVVTAGDGQASVSFTAPSVSGSSTITGYTVTSSPGGITATGTSSPIVITGLTDGVTYTFTVTAMSSAGTGVASAASAAVTPKTSQSITFAAPGAQNMGTSPSLSATASSSLAVAFTSSTPLVCIVSLNQLTLISTGTCTITAAQAGNTVYAAAVSVVQSFTINPEPNSAPVITQGSSTTVTMSEDGAPTAFALTLAATDSNSGDTLTWSLTTQAAHGNASVASNGVVNYTPTANYNGTDVFTVSVSDSHESASIQVNVTLTPVNDAPTISGTPVTSLDQDTAYSFVPVAADVDTSTTLTFSITNKPTWAAFNTATGALTGTPAKADVGITSGIVISVSDGTVTAALPAFALEVISTVDPALPVLTVPASLQVDATALYTPVTLRQLVKLSSTSTQSELDTALDKLAVDSTGKSCCTLVAEGITATKALLLAPGHHEVKWTATNAAGLKTTGVQVVDVRPLVSMSKPQIALRGNTTEFRVILNGQSPSYPVNVSYVIDETTTATSAEHTLTNGTATLTNEGQLEVAVPVTLKPVTGLSNSQLVVRLAGDNNIGATNRHTISIREGNVPPIVILSLTQNGFPTTMITPNGGAVTVTANVVDLNTNDTHSFDWSATSGLADTDGNVTNATRVFSPAGLIGSHQVQVDVADSAAAHVQAQLYFRVLPSLPVLSASTDTDKDGIVDQLEGTGDSDSNGIPDYLDNMPASNVLPQQITATTQYLIECDPGVRCGLGLLALGSSTGGVQILDNEVGTLGDLKVDASFTPVGGIFDFVVADLPTPGQSINIAIPQVAPIPANAVYRKFQKGQWVNFVENADNVIRSALGNPGYCPPPGSTDWKPGLVAGNLCVQLTISDGGPNDGDGIVNSAVVDPGVVSVAVIVPPVEPPVLPPVEIKTKGKGGAVDYALLMLLGGLLLLTHRRSKLLAMGAVLLVSINSQASDFTDKTYLRLDAYKINGSQSEYEFGSRLENYDFTLTQYDVSRTGFQASLGYKWNESIYTELGYLDLGDVIVEGALAADEDKTAFGNSFARYYPVSASGITLVQGVKLSFDSHWSISPEVGVFVWKEEVEVNGDQFTVGDKNNADLLVGLRLDYQITKSLGVGLGVRSLLFKYDTVNLWGVSTRWDF